MPAAGWADVQAGQGRADADVEATFAAKRNRIVTDRT
jgi:hypothetical protein